MNDRQEMVKHGVDAVAGVGVVATWLSYAPEVAAVCAIVWYLIRMGEWLYCKIFRCSNKPD